MKTKLPFKTNEIGLSLLVIINLMIWYPIINPPTLTTRILTIVGLYFIGQLLTGIIIKWKTIKNIAFFLWVIDLASWLFGPYDWIIFLGIVVYMVYRVTNNPMMVKARKDLRDAIDNVEVK